MEKAKKLPKPVENYVQAINASDPVSLAAVFAPDAVVKDVGREIRGINAIKVWADQEIFAVNVTLEVMGAVERSGETVLTVKIDGTFDRTGLPDPLVMENCFTITGDKITALSCHLAGSG